MAAIAICDGCGKQQKMQELNSNFEKPFSWYQRSDEDGIQLACSRECIERISKKTGKTGVILPI